MTDETTADQATLECLEAHLQAFRQRRDVIPSPRAEALATDHCAGAIRALREHLVDPIV